MCTEIGDFNLDGWKTNLNFLPIAIIDTNFYESIYTKNNSSLPLVNKLVICNSSHKSDQKIRRVAMDVSVSGKTEIKIEWGGKDGPSVSGSVSGSVNDDRGNKAEVKVEINKNGESGNATVSASSGEKPETKN